MGARRTHLDFFLARLEAKSKAIHAAFMLAAERIVDRAVLTQVADAIVAGDVERVITLLGLDAAAFAPVDEAIRETFIEGAATATVGLRPNSHGAKLLVLFNVRNVEAERWIQKAGADLVTGFLGELKEVVRAEILAGVEKGANPLTTARALVGTLKKGTSYRKGGTLLLTRARAGTVQKVREALASAEGAGLRAYLALKGRDRRLDKYVREALASGTKVSPEATEKIIGSLADRYLKERADMIARTEALSALNAGKAESFRQATERAGIADTLITREWSSTGDRLVRPDHQHLDGQKVVGLHTPYQLPNGGTILRPGDMTAGAKQVIRCRCMEYLEVDWFNRGIR